MRLSTRAKQLQVSGVSQSASDNSPRRSYREKQEMREQIRAAGAILHSFPVASLACGGSSHNLKRVPPPRRYHLYREPCLQNTIELRGISYDTPFRSRIPNSDFSAPHRF